MRDLRIDVATSIFNAGETTRAVEIAKAARASAVDAGRSVDIRFMTALCDLQTFEDRITAAGFPIEHVDVKLTEEMIADWMRADHEGDQFFQDPRQATDLIAGVREQLSEKAPDLLIHGFDVVSEVAARLERIPTMSFVPFPTHRPWVARHLVKDIPDPLENRLTWALPQFVRAALARALRSSGMRARATRLRDRFRAIDGRAEAASRIWDFVAERGL
jgi:hypothetical protein